MKLAVFAWERWREILAGIALLLLALPFLLGGLELDTDSSRMLSQDDPLTVVSRENRELFGEPNPLLMRLSFSDISGERADELVSELVSETSRWPDISAVGTNQSREIGRGAEHLLLRTALLSAEDRTFDRFVERFQKEGVRSRLLRSRRALVAVDDPEARQLISADLLGLREFLGKEAALGTPQGPLRVTAGSDSRLVLILPAGPAENSDYCRSLLARLDQAVARLRTSLGGAGGVRHAYAGVHAITADSSQMLGEDLVRITALAGFLLILLVSLALRSPPAVLCCLLPLLASLAAVAALARILFHPLNVLTVGFAAVVLGLGLDFALHVVTRYVRYAKGQAPLVALRRTYADCGLPVVVGAASTSAAFLSLLLVGHPGLRQFGLLVSLGLLVTLAITLLSVPALVRLLWREDALSPGSSAPSNSGIFWMTFGARHPGLSSGLSALLVLLGLWSARSFELEMDVFQLASEHLPSVQTARELESEGLLGTVAPIQVRLGGENLSRVVNAQVRLDAELHRLQQEGVISGYDSPAPYLPRVAGAEQARERLARAAAAVQEGRAGFFRQVEELGFRAGPDQEDYYRAVEAAVTPTAVPSDPWLATEELDARVARLVALGEERLFLMTTVWPAAGMDARRAGREQEQVVVATAQTLRSRGEVEVAVSGTSLLYQRMNDSIRDSFPRALAVGLTLVAGMIFLYLRRVSWTIGALAPLFAAIVATLALAWRMGVAITPSTLPFAAVVVGIGIDDAVHLLARARRSGVGSFRGALLDVGPVITLTTLSSAVGFGALAISRLDVVSSLGIVVALGIVACWFFSLFLLPGMVWILDRRRCAPIMVLVLAAATIGLATVAGAEDKGLTPSATEPAVEQGARKVLDRISARLEATGAASCRLVQAKQIAQLEEEVQLEGRLLFQPPRSFRIEMEGDASYLLLSDGERAWMVNRDLEMVDEVPLAQASSERRLSRLLPPFLAENPEDLLQDFRAVLAAGEDSIDVMTLRPRLAASSIYEEIRLEVDSRSRVRRVTVEFVNGDRVDTRFEGWRRLSPQPEDRFRPSAEELSWRQP